MTDANLIIGKPYKVAIFLMCLRQPLVLVSLEGDPDMPQSGEWSPKRTRNIAERREIPSIDDDCCNQNQNRYAKDGKFVGWDQRNLIFYARHVEAKLSSLRFYNWSLQTEILNSYLGMEASFKSPSSDRALQRYMQTVNNQVPWR